MFRVKDIGVCQKKGLHMESAYLAVLIKNKKGWWLCLKYFIQLMQSPIKLSVVDHFFFFVKWIYCFLYIL